jgi:exonuclease III
MALHTMINPGIFLEKLVEKCNRTNVPIVMGGDFNLIRGRGDKNNQNINWGMVDLFNEFIAYHQLQELKWSRGKYTWSNKQVNLVMVNLDRILISLEWGQYFPLCKVSCLMRVGSDHAPIVLST